MYRRRFERLVSRALRQLPREIREQMDNVAVVVEDEPTPDQLATSGVRPGDTLLGLYQGIPLTQRTSAYGLVLPDKVTIFRKPIEACCASDQQIVRQIRQTVVHEVAHHFGLSEADLRRLRLG
jgi:predicted Zn-dependent protease with MMP-like domain